MTSVNSYLTITSCHGIKSISWFFVQIRSEHSSVFSDSVNMSPYFQHVCKYLAQIQSTLHSLVFTFFTSLQNSNMEQLFPSSSTWLFRVHCAAMMLCTTQTVCTVLRQHTSPNYVYLFSECRPSDS